ncbi:MAG: hypothetical protein M3Y36_05630 [Actinomycetota bacterium]|nr:hypothetical protein [Actinomycetota bacterium]
MISGALLGRGDIEDLLSELGRRCAARGLNAEMFLVGGAAMALAYSRDRVTRDLDAVFEPKTAVYEEARSVAIDRGLPEDWLNDAVKGLLPDGPDRGEQAAFVRPGIAVAVASPEYLFAMKALSARAEGDSGDLRILAGILGVTSPEEAFRIVERQYRPERLTAKASLFIQSVFGGTDWEAARPSTPDGEVFVAAHTRNGRSVEAHTRRRPAPIAR